METKKQQKKMKFRIICDDNESLDFITHIISQGCLNHSFKDEDLKERYPTYYPNLSFDASYTKNSEEIEKFFDGYIKKQVDIEPIRRPINDEDIY